MAPNVSMEYFVTYAVLVLHFSKKISCPLVDEYKGFFISTPVFFEVVALLNTYEKHLPLLKCLGNHYGKPYKGNRAKSKVVSKWSTPFNARIWVVK